MHLALVSLALALAAAPGAEASESPSGPPLKLKPKSAISTGTAPRSQAPFISPAGEPELDLFSQHDARTDARRWSCSAERALCYDPDSGRVVYKPARALMPDIPGLQRENISVKRDRVVLRYSF